MNGRERLVLDVMSVSLTREVIGGPGIDIWVSHERIYRNSSPIMDVVYICGGDGRAHGQWIEANGCVLVLLHDVSDGQPIGPIRVFLLHDLEAYIEYASQRGCSSGKLIRAQGTPDGEGRLVLDGIIDDQMEPETFTFGINFNRICYRYSYGVAASTY